MTDVVLIYPYILPPGDRSVFRFPPLGLGYIASYLRERGFSVAIVDHTFLTEEEVIRRVRRVAPAIIGISCMVSLKTATLRLADALRSVCDLLIVGGPYPSVDPDVFLDHFDIVVKDEGEETVYQIVRALQEKTGFSTISGIVYKETERIRQIQQDRGQSSPSTGGSVRTYPPDNRVMWTEGRESVKNLDTLPFPARDLFENEAYKAYWCEQRGYTMTSLITTRGCPYRCEFCSRAVFGRLYRERSPENVVDEIEEILLYGYDRVWFADDCFTLNQRRTEVICDEIIRRVLRIEWECLARVDGVNPHLAKKMKQAGCVRIFFGIESGNDTVLQLMRKQITVEQAKDAVKIVRDAGITAGAFFIIGYPGETDDTILETLRLSTSLPLDYLSYTFPYPLIGTDLYERVKGQLRQEWEGPQGRLVDHDLIFDGPFSQTKLRFALAKGLLQFKMRRSGKFPYLLEKFFERSTDMMFRLL